MRYEVIVKTATGFVAVSIPDCVRKEAVKEAKLLASKYPQHCVFVQWFRQEDGQKGYLNPDGNHAITGEAW